MSKSPRYVYSFSFPPPSAECPRKTNEALRRELSIAEDKMRKLEAENK